MKKSIFMVALAALAMTSCSQDDVLEVKKDSMSFSVATENASRAAVTASDIDQFRVYAFVNEDPVKLYFNEVVAEDGTTGIYKPTGGTYYWPSATVDFYSVYPKTVTMNTTNKAVENYSCENMAPNYHADDFLYSVSLANTRTTADANGSAGINFRHALSQVEFKFWNDDNEALGLDVKINSITIKKVKTVGTYTLPAGNTDAYVAAGTNVCGTWALTSDTKDYFFSMKNEDVALNVPATATATGNGVSYFVMPQELIPSKVGVYDADDESNTSWKDSYFLIDCVITKNGVVIKNGNVAIPYGGEWEQGFKYTYTFKFGEGAGYEPGTETEVVLPISFTITVDDIQATAAEVVDVTM